MENQKIIHELKCDTCGKVCGTITFPAGSKVDLDVLRESHQTLCDDHMPKAVEAA